MIHKNDRKRLDPALLNKEEVRGIVLDVLKNVDLGIEDCVRKVALEMLREGKFPTKEDISKLGEK